MKRILFILLLLAVAGAIYVLMMRKPTEIVLTGTVSTDDVIVSPQIQGRVEHLYVDQGDTVKKGELLAVIEPAGQIADVAYYENAQRQLTMQIEAAKADMQIAKITYDRYVPLVKTNALSQQEIDQAKSTLDANQARYEAATRQAAAATAQEQKAEITLGYTKLYSPTNAVVDMRVALQGEVVNVAQPIVTLVNPDDLWVRADVEETYIDRIHLGDKLAVTLPSGVQRQGTVFYRSIDADYATQRDVSRTKRDIRTFEIRLRCDNTDRALALGMTAYVGLPIQEASWTPLK